MFCNLHQLIIWLFFRSHIPIFYDALHTRWFIERFNKPLQTNPVQEDRLYLSSGDFAKMLLSTSIVYHWAIIILKAISLSFRCYTFVMTCMLFLQATYIVYRLSSCRLLPVAAVWILPSMTASCKLSDITVQWNDAFYTILRNKWNKSHGS
jgi:hypothetical protein